MKKIAWHIILVSSCNLFASAGVPTHVRDSALLLYDVHHYGISLEVSDTGTYITGFTEITATASAELSPLVLELSSTKSVDSVFLGMQKMDSVTHFTDLIRVFPPDPPEKGETFAVRVYYHGEGGEQGFFSGISNRRDAEWGDRVTYTLSEPFLAMDWYVCKQVLTDKADSADLYLTVDEGLMAGSNGLLAGIDSLPGGKLRFHWRSRHPVAYYLLSLAVSRYREYSFHMKSEYLPDSILIQNFIYSDPAYLERYKDDIDATAELIDLYSKWFVPYPFWKEKYGHCLAPMGGGMEHQTMTTLAGFRFNLVAHELAHQWFGDFVTCASWQDIWVNEGFASYGEYLALEALVSLEQAAGWMAQAHEMALSEPEGSVYIGPGEATDVSRLFSTALSYKKGAALLHMIRYELDNDSLFFRSISEFLLRHADSVATGMDFLKILNEVSGSDFGWFFQQWYYGKGYPEFRHTWWQTRDSLVVVINQSGSSEETPLFRTRLDLELQFEDGGDTLIRVQVDQPELKVGLNLKKRVANLVPDPDNWVLDRSEVRKKTVSSAYLRISPNPFRDELNIVFLDGNAEREVRLSDMSGRILQRHFIRSVSHTIHADGVQQGIYLLTVTEGKESYTVKVVKQ